MALCDADPRLKSNASPRQVAGGSLSENILKCQLKPLNAADYVPATFTAGQWRGCKPHSRTACAIGAARCRPAGGARR